VNSVERNRSRESVAFSLIELLTVIAIIAVMMTLLSAGIGYARESGRRSKAKHDVLDIVTAVNAYLTDYGVYPVTQKPRTAATEVTFAIDNSDLVAALSDVPAGANADHLLNPRRTVFIQPPPVKNPAFPRNGVSNGIWYDPWGPQPGKPESGIYHVRIDATYSNTVSDPYPGDSLKRWGSHTGTLPAIHTGVIAWSLARTGIQTYETQDQVLSWK